jgi:DNA-binding IclR family transcriptional regulator
MQPYNRFCYEVEPMQTKGEDNSYTLKCVDNAFVILESLAEHQAGYSLMQLADRLDLSRNKTYRLLCTLCDKGLVERDDISGAYQMGIYSVVLGQKFIMNANVVSYAHPIIEELARKHGEAVYMSVIKGDEVLFLDMVDCEQQVKAAPLIGKRFPFFTNAAGKVMKALDSRDLLEKMFRKQGRRGSAPDFARLETEMQDIRTKGVAVECGGLGDGIISVAVAVRDYAGKVVGAITMIGPSFRLLTERLDTEIIPSLIEGGELLSEKFGYAPA